MVRPQEREDEEDARSVRSAGDFILPLGNVTALVVFRSISAVGFLRTRVHDPRALLDLLVPMRAPGMLRPSVCVTQRIGSVRAKDVPNQCFHCAKQCSEPAFDPRCTYRRGRLVQLPEVLISKQPKSTDGIGCDKFRHREFSLICEYPIRNIVDESSTVEQLLSLFQE